MKPKKIKRVKAWAVLSDVNNRIACIEIDSKKPTRFSIGTWQFYADKDTKIVPCIISYALPKGKKK